MHIPVNVAAFQKTADLLSRLRQDTGDAADHLTSRSFIIYNRSKTSAHSGLYISPDD